ncbi:hypothetical protein VUR80DRAFT_9900 [Thermomyces stellatus]
MGRIARDSYELRSLTPPEPAPVDLIDPEINPWGVVRAMTERIFASSSAVTGAERGCEIEWRSKKSADDWKAWIPEEFRIIY